MPDYQLVWTALPRRVHQGKLEIDAHVAPRLGMGAPPGSTFTLADFPEMENWAATVSAHLTFVVELDGASVVAAQLASDEPVNAGTWNALLPGDVPVTPWSFRDLSDRRIRSYPARWVLAYLRDVYRVAGRVNPTSGSTDLGSLASDLGALVDVRVPDERRDPIPTAGPPVVGPAVGAGSAQSGCSRWLAFLLRLILWFLRVLNQRYLDGAAPGPRPVLPAPPPPPVVTHETIWQAGPMPPAPAKAPLTAIEQQLAAGGGVMPAAALVGDIELGLGARAHAVDIGQAMRFYERPEDESPYYPSPDVDHVAPRPQVPVFDFHQRIGALGDYPTLLRRLGLVIRLQIDRPATDPATIRIRPHWDGAERPAIDHCPVTRCAFPSGHFQAAPAPASELADGVLDLGGVSDRLQTDASPYDIIQVDVDGLALKALATVGTIVRRDQTRLLNLLSFPEPQRGDGPPAAPRGTGLALVRADRAWHLRQRLLRAKSLAGVATGPAWTPWDLTADDLRRGWQVHVMDLTAGGTWLSLTERIVGCQITDAAGLVVDKFDLADEAYVKGSSATSKDSGASDLYLHEALFQWTGWSLAAPRPGKKIEAVTSASGQVPLQDEQASPPAPEPVAGNRLFVRARVAPGSLPMLRFGHRYQFRVPWVDLAGFAADFSDLAPASAPVTFLRFEPLPVPALLPLHPYTEGESLERMAIRSDATLSAEQYATAVLAAHGDYPAHGTRHVFPPKTSQEMAERHGQLDGLAFGGVKTAADRARAYRISARESATLADPKMFDIDDPTLDPAHPVATLPVGTPMQVTVPGGVAGGTSPGTPTTYTVNTTDATLPTPYLPDPIVAGAALRYLPGTEGATAPTGGLVAQPVPVTGELLVQVPFGTGWPDRQPFRIRLAERPGAIDAVTGKESFTNPSDPPQWESGPRVLTVFLAKADRAEVRFSSHTDDGGLKLLGLWDWIQDGTPDLQQGALLGAHKMISPARTLTLVHAVQRPLRPPALTAGAALRAPRQTSAEIQGLMELSVKSTGRLDLSASWDEPIDDPMAPAPTVRSNSVAGIAHWDIEASLPDATPLPSDPVARHEFGDTRHRSVDYRLTGTSRFREYFPSAMSGALSLDGPPVAVEIPSSARPAAPDVLYSVPTLVWEGGEPSPPGTWTTAKRRRGGGGLRVFLGRPWWSSGAGEMLGVILTDAHGSLPPTRSSRLGSDPTWSRQNIAPGPYLTPAMFLSPAVPPATVQLAEGGTGTVIGYQPVWDKRRGQWACDLEIDMSALAGAYWPFVRLAVVRYQPASLAGLEVSKVVIGDWTQLLPERLLDVTVTPTDAEVTLRGPAPAGPFENRVVVGFETAPASAAGDPDELEWSAVPGGPSLDIPTGLDYDLAVTPTFAGLEQVWTAKVALPGPRGAQPLRLCVREYEAHRADSDVLERGQRSGDLLPRIVYADALRLN